MAFLRVHDFILNPEFDRVTKMKGRSHQVVELRRLVGIGEEFERGQEIPPQSLF